MYHIIDLYYQGYEQVIAAFLIESHDGPILVETGPYSTFLALEKGLADHGYRPSDVKHVLLTHIHFDHAGAAWAFAQMGATIYVHSIGIDHLHDPARLTASAARIYGDQMDVLWGEMKGVPLENLRAVQRDEKLSIGGEEFTALHTPGHAAHHIAWQWDDAIFAGDIAGVKINGAPVSPPCPPPDVNLEDWKDSIDLILSRKPNSLILTHFGPEKDPFNHLRELIEILDNWASWMKKEYESGRPEGEITPQFMKYAADQLRSQGVSEHGIKQYEAANPSWMSVAGLIRYWQKKANA